MSSPSQPPPSAVFDRPLLRRRLERAALGPGGLAGFLVDRAARDLAERLLLLKRRFERALDLGTPTAAAAAVLAGSGLVGQVVRAAPAAALASGPAARLVADEEALPFAAAAFDMVVSLMALQQVNDLPGALVQIRRSLRPDGLFVGCLLGGGSLAELREAFLAAELEHEGGASPRVAPFADVRDMGALLQRAGFALPVADVEPVVVRYADAFGLMRDLRAMGLTNALVARRRTPLRRATLLRAAELYQQRFADADGRVRASFDLVWLSGWAPHESQQKPLRPGSARSRLADALGTAERPLGGRRD